MSRHVDEIKGLLFDELEFDSGEEEGERVKKRKKKKVEQVEKKPPVETIVFRDPAKRRKLGNVSEMIRTSRIDDLHF